MQNKLPEFFSAFAGPKRFIQGTLSVVARKAKDEADKDSSVMISVFNDQTGALVDLNLHAPWEAIAPLLERRSEGPESAVAEDDSNTPEDRKRGRPRLGVIGGEVTLLPRHWEWLNNQPGGASVTIRKLVEEARRNGKTLDQIRELREAIYQILLRMGGNNPGFEEATRILFTKGSLNLQKFRDQLCSWPEDLRIFLLTLAERLQKMDQA